MSHGAVAALVSSLHRFNGLHNEGLKGIHGIAAMGCIAKYGPEGVGVWSTGPDGAEGEDRR